MNRRAFRLLAASFLLGLPCLGAARADQTDPRLPPLFMALRVTTSAQQAQLATLQIWQIWHETTNPQAQELIAAGEREMSRGRYDDALAIYDRLVTIAPDFAEGWNRRATVYYLLGDFASSIEDCARVLQLEPRHFGALSGLAEMQQRRGEDGAALATLERLLAISPTQDTARATIQEIRDRLRGRPL